jgi:hypothetical protein
MNQNTGLILGAAVLIVGVVLFVELREKPQPKPGLFSQLGGIADGLGLGSLF